MKTDNKFLIQLLSGLTHKQVFFGLWFAIVGGFVLLMVAFYRKHTRSNFRKPQDGTPPLKTIVDARRLPGQEKADLVVKSSAPTKKR